MRTNTDRKVRRRAIRRWTVMAVTAAVVVVAYYVHAWWVSPGHRIDQFIAASQRGDYASMVALADPPEVRKAGLTPSKLQAAMARVSRTPGGVAYRALLVEPLNDQQAMYNYAVMTEMRPRIEGAVMAGGPSPKRATIWAYNTDRGWKIALTQLLRSTQRGFRTGGPAEYVQMAEAVGIFPGYLMPQSATWRDLRPKSRQGLAGTPR